MMDVFGRKKATDHEYEVDRRRIAIFTTATEKA